MHQQLNPLEIYLPMQNTGEHRRTVLLQLCSTVLSSTVVVGNGKTILLQAWTVPEGSRRFRAHIFQDNRHMKVVMLSDLRSGRLYPPENVPGTHFCYGVSRPRRQSAAGRITSRRNRGGGGLQCTIGSRFATVHFYDLCRAGPSTPDL
jgi:hypothetical protein